MSSASRRGVLSRIPSDTDLARMYFELGRHGASATGKKRAWPYGEPGLEETLTLAAAMSRFDPRLLGIAVELVLKRWNDLNPQRLRVLMRAMQDP